jgi:hypothetical protein
MLGKVDWLWLGVGMLLVIFVLPFITQLLGKAKGSSSTTKATVA